MKHRETELKRGGRELTRAAHRFSSPRDAPTCEPREERHHLTPPYDACSVGQVKMPRDVDRNALGSEFPETRAEQRAPPGFGARGGLRGQIHV
jgi:hypothetical protein